MATVTAHRTTSGNPALKPDVFASAPTDARTMSLAGTSIKTLFLLLVLIGGGAWGWAAATKAVGADIGSGYGNTTVTMPGGFWLASFAALFVGIFIVVNPRRAAAGGIVYALLDGYVLGAISAAFDAQTEGIVGAAVIATRSVFVAALFLYVTRLVRPTRQGPPFPAGLEGELGSARSQTH